MQKPAFQRVTCAEWKAAAKASLNGKPLSQLHTSTAEGIKLKPLYTKKDRHEALSLPGEKPFTRGFQHSFSFPESNVKLETDPISEGAAAGIFPDEKAFEKLKNSPLLTINTVPYHMSGANAVQELALALSEAAFIVKKLQNSHLVFSKCIIHFAAGPDFFIEIAKIRAFRTLWASFMDVFKLEDFEKPKISVETSELTFSVLDPHVNILRAGSAAFSAVLGNIDYLTVMPFDTPTGSTSKLAERIAVNIPRILKHEALLDKVADPAGGSYYIESLTEEIGRLAWDMFSEIEESGGIKKALLSGTIQKQILDVQEKRQLEVETQKKQLIGTNIYANSLDKLKDKQQIKVKQTKKGEKIVPLPSKRFAEPFENLRRRSWRIQQTGQSAIAGLICLGDIKTNKPPADYVAGMLAVGGIETVRSTNCMSIEEAIEFVKKHPLPYYCICGMDFFDEQFGQDLINQLKKIIGTAVIDIAGKQKPRGISGSIAAGDNLVEKLSALLSLYEGGNEN